MTKLAEQAARTVVEHVRLASGAVVEPQDIAKIIDAGLAPLMEALREAWVSRRKLCRHHTNVEEGNYLECLICQGESPGGKPLVDEIKHDERCWVSRARKIVGEG